MSGTHLVAEDYRWGKNPSRSFPSEKTDTVILAVMISHASTMCAIVDWLCYYQNVRFDLKIMIISMEDLQGWIEFRFNNGCMDGFSKAFRGAYGCILGSDGCILVTTASYMVTTALQQLILLVYFYYCSTILMMLFIVTTAWYRLLLLVIFSAALHGWYYMVFVTTVGEEYDKVFNHLDMLNAPLEGKGRIQDHIGGSYYSFPCSILSIGKDRKTSQRYPDVPTTSWRIFISSMESFQGLTRTSPYDNESWNDPRDFAKPVKAISLHQDVSSTSDRRLIELENQVKRLMEAHLASTQPTQVNKITTSCEICSSPHDTQYCMEDSEQAFVEYASSRTDKAGGK
ncbi:hypothetical protein Tco_0971815 [Tanacetum coccineum]